MISINQPWIGEEEKLEVMKVLEENALTSASNDGGKRVQILESLLERFLNIDNVIVLNSGTAAIYAALLCLGIGPGDEVLLPSFTFVATANSVIATGAKPVFVDINTKDYTMDIKDLKEKITKRSKAIIPVHLYGHPADMEEILEVAATQSLEIIEDACQSLGSTYDNLQTGTIGKIGCFSFYASKVLTAGEGGAVSTKDAELASILKMVRNHGMVEGNDTRRLGLNLRLPELCAAIASVQMNRLPALLGGRRKNSKILTELLSSIHGKLNIPFESERKKFNWYLYTVAFQSESTRDKIQNALIHEGIGATIYYAPPVHKTPYYSNVGLVHLPNTDWAASHVLSLPVHPRLSEEDMNLIVNCIKKKI
jgi:dTDP-4-amino-4,6-dideoxygalactose transaminase